jgi:ketosteroid isomerase-like protein
MNHSAQFLDNHQAKGNIELFRRSRLVLSVVCLLCSGARGHAVQVSLTADTKAFQQLENRWSEAIGKRDQYALELVLSSEFVDVSATGDVTTRNQQIAKLIEKDSDPLSLDQRVLSVRISGNVAVVVGSYTELRRIHGKPVKSSGMFTHVFQKTRTNWLCIIAHRTTTTEGAPQKANGANSKNDVERITTGAGHGAQ